MGKQIKEDECPEGLPGWLATFGDLMSLLLTFFVLLLSFASMEVVEFQQAMGALQGALGVLSGEPQMNLPIRQSMPKSEGNLQQAQVIAKAAQELESAIEEAGLQGDVKMDESTTGLVIRVADRLFFESGGVTLKASSTAFLNKLGAVLKPLTNPINVQGHTDNRPINSIQFASNWELSGMRALQIARHFIDKSGISPSRISFTGYSEYRWIVPNNSDENMGKNRRVEIHILYDREPHTPPKQIYEAVESNQIQIRGREIK
jgi:chemotaxis protein MotB